MQDEVTVTQIDRIAACQIADAMNDRNFVRAHELAARHRHQAERETLARMEPVAWMYERKGPWPARYFHDERTPAYLDAGEAWTETPLYALPPAPEAGQ